MRAVIVVVMVLVCINYLLKLTYYRRLYMLLISSVVSALFVGLSLPFAIEQSASEISHWLSDTALMLNIAVILTVNVIVQMAFCFLHAQIHCCESPRRINMLLYHIMLLVPDLLIFPVLFYILVTAVFSLPGVSFQLVAWTLAAMVFIVIPIATYLIKWVLPEKSIRIELLFLSNALIAVLGITASVNGRTAAEGVSCIDGSALSSICMLAAIGSAIGFIMHRIKLKIKKNR